MRLEQTVSMLQSERRPRSRAGHNPQVSGIKAGRACDLGILRKDGRAVSHIVPEQDGAKLHPARPMHNHSPCAASSGPGKQDVAVCVCSHWSKAPVALKNQKDQNNWLQPVSGTGALHGASASRQKLCAPRFPPKEGSLSSFPQKQKKH